MVIILVLFLFFIPEFLVQADSSPVIGAYFYLFDNGYDNALNMSEQIPWEKINRLYIAFATVKDGILTNLPDTETIPTEERVRNVVSLCRKGNPDADIYISSNYGDEITEEYLNAAEDPDRFAESVLAYLQKYDLDGYDMDWEDHQINNYIDEQKGLLAACNSALKKQGLLTQRNQLYGLTCTIWPGVHDPDTVSIFSDYVDQLNLMTYGPGDRYDLLNYADSYAEAGVPYEKMIAGVESEYGYSDNSGHDTEESVKRKAEFVKSKGLAGLMNWRIDNDMAPDDDEGEQRLPTFQITNWIAETLLDQH